MAEHLTVDQVVAGSTPVAHPKFIAKTPKYNLIKAFFFSIRIISQFNLHSRETMRDPCAIG